MDMKKIISVFLCFITIFFCAGCGEKDKKKEFASYGQFYELKEVYEQGLISREQLLSVAYYGAKSENEGLFDENYTPLPKTPEELSEKTVRKIKESALHDLFDSFGEMDEEEESLNRKVFDFDAVDVFYYAIYNDYVIVSKSIIGVGLCVIKTIEIDGIKFTYPDTSYELLAWKENA